MSRVTRRRFLQTAAAASTAFPLFTIAGTKASGRVIGANDTIRIGVAGINGRGGAHMDAFAAMDHVEVSYLIDPDSRLFDSRSRRVEDRGGNQPKCVQDLREALDDESLDALAIASCNHLHSLQTVWACQAGKDVFVEKPISHNVFEGRQCVEAARKYDCIVQHGTQQRSSQSRADQMAAIQSGKYGKLLVSKGYCCKPRWSIGYRETSSPPPELDFNLWLGPAPLQAFHGNLVHYNWHWFWDTGNGDVGNQGVHEMDVARWAIKDATLPKKVWSLGGRFLPDGKDQGETPNMQLAVYEYDDCLLVFETRGLVGREGAPPDNVSNEFYTTEGVIRDGRFHPNNGGRPEPVQGEGPRVTGGGVFGSFIAAMRSRNHEDINGNAEEGHYSSALCHLGNISYRLGQPEKFDKKLKAFGDNHEVAEAFEAIKDNLKAVDIDLDETTYTVGRVLNFDAASEKFIDDSEADQLLTRQYREPFVVPESV